MSEVSLYRVVEPTRRGYASPPARKVGGREGCPPLVAPGPFRVVHFGSGMLMSHENLCLAPPVERESLLNV